MYDLTISISAKQKKVKVKFVHMYHMMWYWLVAENIGLGTFTVGQR